MYKTHEVTIGEHRYEITDWSIVKVMHWQYKILSKAKEVVPHLVGAFEGADLTGSEIEASFSAIMHNMSEEQLVEFIKSVLKGVRRQGVGEVDLDTMFCAGNSLDIYKLVYEVFKWQFRDFFTALQGDKSILTKAMNRIK